MLQFQNKFNHLNHLIIPAIVTVAIIIAPVMPDPICFWLSLFAILMGPGWGIPMILFSNREIALPELIFIVVIISIFIDTVIFTSLNSFGIYLSQFVVSMAVLLPTYVTTIGAIVFSYRNKYVFQVSNNEESSWVSFALGIVFAISSVSILFLIK